MSALKEFSKQIDNTRIEQAINDAENLTSGEIRVVLQAGKVEDPVQRAEKRVCSPKNAGDR